MQCGSGLVRFQVKQQVNTEGKVEYIRKLLMADLEFDLLIF